MSSGGGTVRTRGGNLCPPRSIPNAVRKCGTAGGIERDRHVISRGGSDDFPHWVPLVHLSDSEEKPTRDQGFASGLSRGSAKDSASSSLVPRDITSSSYN
jgi:hypothetical protein